MQISEKRRILKTYGMVLWWPWLTSKRVGVARICQHQLNFLFLWWQCCCSVLVLARPRSRQKNCFETASRQDCLETGPYSQPSDDGGRFLRIWSFPGSEIRVFGIVTNMRRGVLVQNKSARARNREWL